jgi:hypothetical protein
MAHVLILGTSESGKTTLAKMLARRYKAQGMGVLVLDPLMDPQWHADFMTADETLFLERFWASRNCFAFMDEGGDSVGRFNTAMAKTATRGRHWGHSCHYITQRATQLAPIVRDQCRHLFAFALSRKDGETLAADFLCDDLLNVHALGQGDYIHVERFGGVKRGNVFGKPMKEIRNDSSASNRRADRDGNRPDSARSEEEKARNGNGGSASNNGNGSTSGDGSGSSDSGGSE